MYKSTKDNIATRRQKKTGMDLAMEDIQAGRVTQYASVDDMLAHYFADKAQEEMDALWDDGTIDEHVVEQWGHERMRTPYVSNKR